MCPTFHGGVWVGACVGDRAHTGKCGADVCAGNCVRGDNEFIAHQTDIIERVLFRSASRKLLFVGDGDAKKIWSRRVTATVLFAVIGAMPMRQSETRRLHDR